VPRPKGSKNKTNGFRAQLKALALADLAGEGELSLAKLVELRDSSRNETIQLAAAIELKNTAFGKPKQQLDHGMTADLLKSVTELRRKRGLDLDVRKLPEAED